MQQINKLFNQQSRGKNIVKASLISALCNVVNILMGFGYRAIFLYLLSVAYLGVNGLFSNILNLLSLAELGITSAITFHFYKPISENDIKKVGELMAFFKKVYRVIACVIALLGACIIPFIPLLIKDNSEVPNDINIYIVYVLFLMQTVSTYMYSYKQTLLTADQKQYTFSLLHMLINVCRYMMQILSLFVWKNYTLTLLIGIITTIILNYIISVWVTERYRPVFEISTRLSRVEIREIYNETKATLLHKVGGTILTSTDNIILTKFIGIVITGIYSNYSMILSNLSNLFMQLFGSFTSSLGNAHVELNAKERFLLYRRLLFLNFWMAGFVTTCLYMLLNDFIALWVGNGLCLDSFTVCVLCIQFYLEMVRIVSTSYTTACGLFVKDKARPIIEAFLNLVVSILAVQKIGIAGIFIGTIVSHILTVVWREPLLLYKYEFRVGILQYWIIYVKNAVSTLMSIYFASNLKSIVFDSQNTILTWLGTALISCIVYCLITFVLNLWNMDFKYYIYRFKSGIKSKISSSGGNVD